MVSCIAMAVCIRGSSFYASTILERKAFVSTGRMTVGQEGGRILGNAQHSPFVMDVEDISFLKR